MAQPADEQPAHKFSIRFWVLLGGAFVVVTAAFFALMSWNISQGRWSPVLGTVTVVVFTAALIALSMTPYFVMRRSGAAPRMRGPHRRYMMRFLPAMLVYTLMMIPAAEFFNDEKPTGVLAWAIAIAPAIPVLFAIRALMLYYKEEDDEFLKAMAIQSHILATGLMMAVATAYGFLDLFGLVPHVQAWAVFPVWAVCLVPAQLVTYRKFK